jgi:putative ABC transport system ATP-binding protein
MAEIITIRHVYHEYKDGSYVRKVLEDVNWSIEEGCFYTVVGPSGSGKSTLLSLIGGLEKVQKGEILFLGESPEKMGFSRYRRDMVSIILQQYNLFSYLSARENVEYVLRLKNSFMKNQKEIIYALLEKVGVVRSKADRLISKLSGGEQQRVAIARALAADTPVILADEPTGNLDEETAQEIMKLFLMLVKDYGKTVIMVTHSEHLASYGDRKIKLKDGVLLEKGDFK